jgi:prepilin peptidase CpaA
MRMELWMALPAALLLVAAGTDLIWRIIPDWTSASLAALGVAFLVANHDIAAALTAILIAAALFAGGFGLFAAGAMGGGDVKLAGAAGLWLSAANVETFILAMSVTGAALALAMAAVKAGGAALGGARGAASLRAARRASVPYGVAIAAGGIAAMMAG